MGTGHFFGWGAPFMWVFWLLLFALVAWLIGVAIRRPGPSNRARKQLDKRYANGEIDRQTYDRIKRDLEQ